MNITFILPTRGVTFGGLETIADNLSAVLARRGHSVTFLLGAAPGRARRNDLPRDVEPVVIPFLHWTSIPVRVLARLTRQPPLNLQSLSFFLSSLTNRRARRYLSQCDVAVTFLEGEAMIFSNYLQRRHIGTLYYYSGGIDARWARRDRSTRRVAISQTIATRSAIQHAYPCHGVVTPGVSADWLIQPCRAENMSEPHRLVYTGRLEPGKRPEFLLETFRALANDFPSLTLRLVGDGPMRQELGQRASDLGLAERVIFTGAQSSLGVRAELQQADVFLFPSKYESFGLSVLEAQAAGVPVIASDLPALREATGGHAFLLPPNDLAPWIETTQQLLNNSLLRREKMREGRAWAAAHTWERAVAELEKYLVESLDLS